MLPSTVAPVGASPPNGLAVYPIVIRSTPLAPDASPSTASATLASATLASATCLRRSQCVKKQGHRGACKVPKLAPVVAPAVVASCLRYPGCPKEQGHVGRCKGTPAPAPEPPVVAVAAPVAAAPVVAVAAPVAAAPVVAAPVAAAPVAAVAAPVVAVAAAPVVAAPVVAVAAPVAAAPNRSWASGATARRYLNPHDLYLQDNLLQRLGIQSRTGGSASVTAPAAVPVAAAVVPAPAPGVLSASDIRLRVEAVEALKRSTDMAAANFIASFKTTTAAVADLTLFGVDLDPASQERASLLARLAPEAIRTAALKAREDKIAFEEDGRKYMLKKNRWTPEDERKFEQDVAEFRSETWLSTRAQSIDLELKREMQSLPAAIVLPRVSLTEYLDTLTAALPPDATVGKRKRSRTPTFEDGVLRGANRLTAKRVRRTDLGDGTIVEYPSMGLAIKANVPPGVNQYQLWLACEKSKTLRDESGREYAFEYAYDV